MKLLFDRRAGNLQGSLGLHPVDDEQPDIGKAVAGVDDPQRPITLRCVDARCKGVAGRRNQDQGEGHIRPAWSSASVGTE